MIRLDSVPENESLLCVFAINTLIQYLCVQEQGGKIVRILNVNTNHYQVNYS